MKSKHLTSITATIRQVLAQKPRAHYDDQTLLLETYRSHGLKLSPEQEAKFVTLPSAATVMRSANREKKKLTQQRKTS